MQENVLLDPMFDIPGSNINSVEITEAVVAGSEPAKYIRTSRGEDADVDNGDEGSETVTRAVNN